ncbi:high-affinity choline transporter 1-like isoform X2 [Dermacentor albipictus]|uniref:high-affinity choline transporter 1-like isoform X2 n=1 Tax=Dermacentor albipictus TaxID=60249 RepID=UPI0038FC8EED
MAINVPGLVAIVFFYLVILVVGIWAGRKGGGPEKDSQNVTIGEQSNIMLAGRNIGLFVGVFTMTATWVGGGYINGTAEIIYVSGLAWCQAPFGYAISLAIGGNLFAVKMRKAGYKTMLDPFQKHFGTRMGGLLFLPALCGEVFWSAAILAALGATVEVIMEFDRRESVIASACIALFYTFTGGLYSVAYTDVVQLGAIFLGLWLCLPFAMFHEAVGVVSYPRNDFVGSVEWTDFGTYWDSMLLLMMGGIPWQVYFQRVLSSRTAEGAELLSYMAALGCLFMAIPPVVVGAVAKAANFTAAGYTKPVPLVGDAASLVLPLVLQYLTPGFVSAMGLGAVSAAVMSSSDSSILSAASMFAWNIYKLTFRQQDYVNTYGSLTAYMVGAFFRAAGGEDLLGVPAFIHYPYYDDEKKVQRFPFKTFSMCMCFITLISVSLLASCIFQTILPPSADIFRCFTGEEVKLPGERRGMNTGSLSGSGRRALSSGEQPISSGSQITKTESSSAVKVASNRPRRASSSSAKNVAKPKGSAPSRKSSKGSKGGRSNESSRASRKKGRKHKRSPPSEESTSSSEANRKRKRRGKKSQPTPDSSSSSTDEESGS